MFLVTYLQVLGFINSLVSAQAANQQQTTNDLFIQNAENCDWCFCTFDRIICLKLFHSSYQTQGLGNSLGF